MEAVASAYRDFATRELAGNSPTYVDLCLGVADDGELLSLIADLPPAKQQPNLLLASARLLGSPVREYLGFRSFVTDNWATMRDTMLARSTQTNEPGRCAGLLPLLATLPQPLALIEVGCSAGLCLYPDRYAYRYDDAPVLGAAEPVLDCRTSGRVPVPQTLPRVVWRAGIDLNPLDVNDPADAQW